MPELNTERLKLVTFTVDMMKASLNSIDDLMKIVPYKVDPEWPMDVYKQLFPYKIERFTKYPEENEWEGIIILKKENRIIGDMGFKGGPNQQDEIDLGYSIVPRYQGNGYATEMAKAMISWGLKRPGVKKVTANCLETNDPSIRVLEKAGLKQIGKAKDRWLWSS